MSTKPSEPEAELSKALGRASLADDASSAGGASSIGASPPPTLTPHNTPQMGASRGPREGAPEAGVVQSGFDLSAAMKINEEKKSKKKDGEDDDEGKEDEEDKKSKKFGLQMASTEGDADDDEEDDDEDEEDEEDEDEDEEDDDFDEDALRAKIMEQLLSNPGASDLLSSMGTAELLSRTMPVKWKRRVRALQKIHDETMDVQSEFKRALLDLEKKFAAKYIPLYDRRRDIIVGKHEPKDDELADDCAVARGDVSLDGAAAGEDDDDEIDGAIDGVPEFWLHVLNNHPITHIAVKEQDEEPLSSLVDIRVVLGENGASFTLEFHFAQGHGFFSEKVLKKHFEVEEDPESGEHEIISVTSTEPSWIPGKNPTIKKVVVTQRHPKKGIRRVTREEQCESFFNFFESPDREDLEAKDPESLQRAHEDYEFAEIFREKLVPNAFSWFTGEAKDPDYDGDSDEEDEDEFGDEDDFDSDEDDSDEDDDEEEEDDDDNGRGKRGAGGKKRRGGGGKKKGGKGGSGVGGFDFPAPGNGAQAPECKQS